MVICTFATGSLLLQLLRLETSALTDDMRVYQDTCDANAGAGLREAYRCRCTYAEGVTPITWRKARMNALVLS
jgi:hypothetical protein